MERQIDMAGAVSVLEVVESLPHEAIGIVHFEAHSSVLVDSRVICWAAARGTPQHLTDSFAFLRVAFAVVCSEAEARRLSSLLTAARNQAAGRA